MNAASCLYVINIFLNRYLFPTQLQSLGTIFMLRRNFDASQKEMNKMFHQFVQKQILVVLKREKSTLDFQSSVGLESEGLLGTID